MLQGRAYNGHLSGVPGFSVGDSKDLPATAEATRKLIWAMLNHFRCSSEPSAQRLMHLPGTSSYFGEISDSGSNGPSLTQLSQKGSKRVLIAIAETYLELSSRHTGTNN
jgi:hypothetical protein